MAVDTLPSIRVANPGTQERLRNLTEGKTAFYLENSAPHDVLLIMELIITVFFVLEFILAFGSCPNKVAFVKSVWNWIQYLSLFPSIFFVTVFLFDLNFDKFGYQNKAVVFGLIFRMRIFRIFFLSRLGHHFPGLRVMYLTIRTSLVELLLLVILLAVACLFYGSALFYSELKNDQIQSIPHGMWWALITMTTVGYGDITPEATWGFLLGSSCALSGILIIALPIPLVASNFSRFYTAMKTMRRREMNKRVNRVDVTH